jgi:hypothetical protein
MGEPGDGPDDFSMLFEAAFARLQVTVLDACEEAHAWPEKVALGIRAGLAFAADDPSAAQVLTNEALAHGAEGVARYERLVIYLGERLYPGRDERREGRDLPGITERAMAGGVLTLVSQRIDQGRAEELTALAREAIQFVLTPYLGAGEARRVAAQVEPAGPEQGLT